MFPVEISYAFCVSICIAIAGWMGWKQGKEQALGVGMALSFAAGSWIQLSVFEMPINVATSVAIVFLIAFSVHSGRKIWSPLVLLDVLISVMAIWHVVVDVYYGGHPIGVTVASYGEWVLPYVAGRYAVLHRESIANLSPWFVSVGVFVSLAAIWESFTGINLWEMILSPVDDLVSHPHFRRYGLLYRAVGPTRHSIFLGAGLLLLLPWAVAFIEARKNEARNQFAGWLALVGIVLGIGATVSRGPILGLLIAILFTLCVKVRIARWLVITATLITLVISVARFERVIEFLDSTQGSSKGNIVNTSDGPEVHTGTRNRLFVFKIYSPLVIKGGPLGYGTESTDSFPPEIPGLPLDSESRERLGIVDNSFIVVGLRFGWIGTLALAALFAVSIINCLQMLRTASTFIHPCGLGFCTAMASILFAIACVLVTVFWSYDIAFWVLMMFGIVAGLRSQETLVLRR